MAEKIKLQVDLEANLGKVVEATKGLKLDKSQSERLEKYSKGAQLALDTGDLKTFQKNFNSLMKLFQDAAAATGEVSDAIKELTSRQSKLNQEINRLKDKNINLLFYEDIRKSKNLAYQKIKEQMIEISFVLFL